MKSLRGKIEKKPGCIQSALAVLGDKWTPLILRDLASGPAMFSELEKSLAGISPRTLSQRMDMLEEASIVTKHLYCPHPPRYKYELTKKGEELEIVLHKMAEWGEKYHDAQC